jgi:hypothetical protein
VRRRRAGIKDAAAEGQLSSAAGTADVIAPWCSFTAMQRVAREIRRQLLVKVRMVAAQRLAAARDIEPQDDQDGMPQTRPVRARAMLYCPPYSAFMRSSSPDCRAC